LFYPVQDGRVLIRKDGPPGVDHAHAVVDRPVTVNTFEMLPISTSRLAWRRAASVFRSFAPSLLSADPPFLISAWVAARLYAFCPNSGFHTSLLCSI